jgi:hypothetical protein
MRIAAILHGGASYAFPDSPSEYPSLSAALYAWDDRRSSNGWRKCADDDGRLVYFPCWGDAPASAVDEDGSWSAGYAYVMTDEDEDASEYVDVYPDYELRVGPRGGLRWGKVS